jgi:hypothetical protein
MRGWTPSMGARIVDELLDAPCLWCGCMGYARLHRAWSGWRSILHCEHCGQVSSWREARGAAVQTPTSADSEGAECTETHRIEATSIR